MECIYHSWLELGGYSRKDIAENELLGDGSSEGGIVAQATTEMSKDKK